MNNKFDVIVIGGGHAGIEACHAAAKMGMQTLLLTLDKFSIGRPSCNPSIGGTAKGHIVKEIDALGGVQAVLADRAGLQFKMLNKSKGPAIWSPRAQIDKYLYPQYALEILENLPNLTIGMGSAKQILIEHDKAIGIMTLDDEQIFAKAVILCAGTFLNGLMWTGYDSTEGGRIDEPSVKFLSDGLKSIGFEVGRLKTGTPPRISAKSIDYSQLKPEYGDTEPEPFSYLTEKVENKILCHSTETNFETHAILRTGFSRSPLFQGRIKGIGPRYCPSIEDKINRFADRDSHKILLEPEGLNDNSIYVNGFSTSLPLDIQIKGLRSIRGLENAEIIRPGYAIEYDYFYPYQLRFTLETKDVGGLYFAGQINGTSGYEEAAGQGLVAGINAALKIKNEEPFMLSRAESYIGVLVDDLVNKSTEEPYRMFTSLAEYRLLLRQDNADFRLMQYANKFGLISDEVYDKVNLRKQLISDSIEESKKVKLTMTQVNSYLQSIDESEVIGTTDIYNLTKRSKTDFAELMKISLAEHETKSELFEQLSLDKKAVLQAGFEIKYEGYIARQLKDIEYFLNNEHKFIPDNFDYDKVQSFSTEAREKLKKIRPGSLGQASRISGVSASDVSILSLYLK
ncbi:MAG: tRNA uridine-5-carboxymethylaminomethyl(34) synthesis enzyme MnmG [bacterium]